MTCSCMSHYERKHPIKGEENIFWNNFQFTEILYSKMMLHGSKRAQLHLNGGYQTEIQAQPWKIRVLYHILLG